MSEYDGSHAIIFELLLEVIEMDGQIDAFVGNRHSSILATTTYTKRHLSL